MIHNCVELTPWSLGVDHAMAWQLASGSGDDGNDDDNDEDESGSEEGERPKVVKSAEAKNDARPSLPYREFRQFLETGCMGSPITGYPAVLIILSTIPSSVSFAL